MCFVQVVVTDICFSFDNIVVGVKAFVLVFQMYIDLYICIWINIYVCRFIYIFQFLCFVFLVCT